uniref:C-type lectin domain family 2 member F-like n=1 Tax=Jaculus jaculus TaxID=51337 RepID=UPI001E1B3AB5|nr:C-type lectin domain family 2 member F-like [Jaculus jaculus]
MLEAPSPGELQEKEDEADLKSEAMIVQSRHSPLVMARKMIVIWTLVCGGLILILWETVQFLHKFEIKNDFRNKTCLENLKLCPHGWKQVRKNCFFQSEEEDSLIRQLHGSSYWIGLNKHKSHKIWTWADESPLNQWYHVPDHGDCAFTHQKGLDSANYLDLKKFICSRLRYCP